MNETKMDLKLHIKGTIEQVVSEQVLPNIRETFGDFGNGAKVDTDFVNTSSEQYRSQEVSYPKRTWVTSQNRIETLVIRSVTIRRFHLSHTVVMMNVTLSRSIALLSPKTFSFLAICQFGRI